MALKALMLRKKLNDAHDNGKHNDLAQGVLHE